MQAQRQQQAQQRSLPRPGAIQAPPEADGVGALSGSLAKLASSSTSSRPMQLALHSVHNECVRCCITSCFWHWLWLHVTRVVTSQAVHGLLIITIFHMSCNATAALLRLGTLHMRALQ
jgi:hypothetical protein